jgi:hypothetical protein
VNNYKSDDDESVLRTVAPSTLSSYGCITVYIQEAPLLATPKSSDHCSPYIKLDMYTCVVGPRGSCTRASSLLRVVLPHRDIPDERTVRDQELLEADLA